MSHLSGQAGVSTLARKLNFLFVTFFISAAVVLGMVAVGGMADGQERHDSISPSRAAALTPENSGDNSSQVVTAQRSNDRELAVPPAPKKGADASLYLPNIADIVERANAAVVNIRATEIIRPGSKKRRPSTGDPFEFFFPRPDGKSPHGGM